MAQAVEEWYKQMPIITRSYLTAAVVTTVGCSLEIISPYNLYLNPKLIVQQYEIWRLVTNFLYFRKMDLDFLFHMFFLARYCKLLEENSFRGRTADFFFMLLFGATVLTGIVLIGGMIPYLSESFANILFLSNSLTFMMVYVWSKHNPYIHMSFLGLFTFTAAYLPWVLLGFSILVGSTTWVDLLPPYLIGGFLGCFGRLPKILERYQQNSGRKLWDAEHESLSAEIDRIKKENDNMQIELRHLKGEDLNSLYPKELIPIEEGLQIGLASVRDKQMEIWKMHKKNEKLLEEENEQLTCMLHHQQRAMEGNVMELEVGYHQRDSEFAPQMTMAFRVQPIQPNLQENK